MRDSTPLAGTSMPLHERHFYEHGETRFTNSSVTKIQSAFTSNLAVVKRNLLESIVVVILSIINYVIVSAVLGKPVASYLLPALYVFPLVFVGRTIVGMICKKRAVLGTALYFLALAGLLPAAKSLVVGHDGISWHYQKTDVLLLGMLLASEMALGFLRNARE